MLLPSASCVADINRLVPKQRTLLTNDFFRRIWRNSYSYGARPSGRRSVREESGETTGEFRIDLERVIVDPDYRRRVLLRLRAETEASVPPLAIVPHEG
jgi:hypothetical protein